VLLLLSAADLWACMLPVGLACAGTGCRRQCGADMAWLGHVWQRRPDCCVRLLVQALHVPATLQAADARWHCKSSRACVPACVQAALCSGASGFVCCMIPIGAHGPDRPDAALVRVAALAPGRSLLLCQDLSLYSERDRVATFTWPVARLMVHETRPQGCRLVRGRAAARLPGPA
jgi:hypothetical protein